MVCISHWDLNKGKRREAKRQAIVLTYDNTHCLVIKTHIYSFKKINIQCNT